MRRFVLFLIVFVMAFPVGAGTAAALPMPHVVVSIVGLVGPDCSAAVVEISNLGRAEQPFGWTLTLRVKPLGIDQTYEGQQPLPAGASYQTLIGTGVSAAGTYRVWVIPGGTLGKSRAGYAVMSLPGACGPSTPELLMPINNEAIQQNNPNIGCPPHPTAGYGYRTLFDWTDSTSSAGITGYHVFAEHVGAVFPIVDTIVADSELLLTECNTWVGGPNLDSWHWRVKAIDALGNESPWTEFGLFQFEPCLIDGVACSSP